MSAQINNSAIIAYVTQNPMQKASAIAKYFHTTARLLNTKYSDEHNGSNFATEWQGIFKIPEIKQVDYMWIIADVPTVNLSEIEARHQEEMRLLTISLQAQHFDAQCDAQERMKNDTRVMVPLEDYVDAVQKTADETKERLNAEHKIETDALKAQIAKLQKLLTIAEEKIASAESSGSGSDTETKPKKFKLKFKGKSA
jgi:hypothetical protein